MIMNDNTSYNMKIIKNIKHAQNYGECTKKKKNFTQQYIIMNE